MTMQNLLPDNATVLRTQGILSYIGLLVFGIATVILVLRVGGQLNGEPRIAEPTVKGKAVLTKRLLSCTSCSHLLRSSFSDLCFQKSFGDSVNHL